MSVSYDFSGKVALITGSSSGIGASTALLFAKSGAQVVITGRNEDNVKSVAKQALEVSPNSLIALEVVADITKEEDINRLVDSTINEFGKLDILVNNAAMALTCFITDQDYFVKYLRVMNMNLTSVIHLTHKCVQHLEKTKGNIINISSVRSVQTGYKKWLYCMSKCALDMFTKCSATELGPRGIRVNSVSPAAVRTNCGIAMGASKEETDRLYEMHEKVYPVGRCGEGVDIANSVLYLASDQASFITGSILVADGGHLAANVNIQFYTT